MFLLTLVLLLAFANAKTPKRISKVETYPECDLVNVGYFNLTVHEKVGEKDAPRKSIEFSWDRKTASYSKIGTVNMYTFRHGPLEDGKLSKDANVYFRGKSRGDSVKIHLTTPEWYEGKYGVQVCALTKFNGFNRRMWEHAWTGEFDLAQLDKRGALKIENTYLPQCDLVGSSFLEIINSRNGNWLDVIFGWDEKPSSYEKLKSIDHYRVRHGVQDSWGASINESDAKYMNVDNKTAFLLTRVPYGSYYGVQICAMESEEDYEINWDSQAWLGGMNFTSYVPTPVILDKKETGMIVDLIPDDAKK